MSTVAYDNFLPQVMPQCPDVIESIAVDAVRQAAIEFLEETHWLKFTAPPLTGVAGIASYPVQVPDWSELVRVHQATYDNIPLTPKSDDELRAMYATYDWRQVEGLPRWYIRDPDDDGSIIICPIPEVTEGAALLTVAVVRPTRTSTTIDSSVWDKWYTQIAAGACARLMRTPQQSYTNQRLADIQERIFRDGIGKAKIDAYRSNERASLVMRPPRFV